MASHEYLGKVDLVTEMLREMITTGELAPGTELRQRDLARQFNVSPTPIREALRTLESEGLVGSELHRGARVATVDVEQQAENYLILAELEALATRLAIPKLTPEDLAEIRAYEEAFAEVSENDPAARDLNRKLHFRIYEVAGSPLLLSLMRLLWSSFGQGPRLWRPHADSVREHRGLVEALADGHVEAAAQLTRQHVLGSINWMRAKLAPDAGQS